MPHVICLLHEHLMTFSYMQSTIRAEENSSINTTDTLVYAVGTKPFRGMARIHFLRVPASLGKEKMHTFSLLL